LSNRMTIGIIRILSGGRRNASIVQSIRTSKYRKQITFGIAFAWGIGGYQLNKIAEKAKEDGTIDSPVLSKTDNPLKLEDSKHYRDLTIPEVILKSLGFGRDWMRELDPEKRIKIHKWPWLEWWRFNVLPSETRYMVHENTTKYLQHEYYVSEICPDCYRVTLYGSAFILFTKRVLYGYLSLKAKFFGFLVVASCLVGLVCGQSGGSEFGSGNDQMAHRNNEDMLNNIYSITQRRMNLEIFKFNMWGLPRNAILHEKKRAEQTLSQRVIPIEQIDDYVRKTSREELRAVGVDKDKWAFGEPFPEAVQIRITSECLEYRGQPADISTKFVPPEKTEDMDEMDHFMMKLSKKLENSEPKSK